MPPRGKQISRRAAPMREAAAASPSTNRGVADAETEAATQEARASAAEAVAEAEAVDDAEPELYQESDSDNDERMVYEPTDPSEPRCPSGDSSSDSEEEEVSASLAKRPRLLARALRHSSLPRCPWDFSGQPQPSPDSSRLRPEQR